MKQLTRLLIISLLALTLFTGCSDFPNKTRDSYSQSIDLTGVTALSVLTENGNVKIVGTATVGSYGLMTVERTVEGSNESENQQFCQNLTVTQSRSGQTLSLIANYPPLPNTVRSITISIYLSVPQNLLSSITANSTNGNLHFEELGGIISGNLENGNIIAMGPGAFSLNTINGDITLRPARLTGSTTAQTFNGNVIADVSVEAMGTHSFGSNNGQVEIRIPQSTSAVFDLRNTTGSINVWGLTLNTTTTTAHYWTGKINSNDGTTRLNLSTVNGNVKLALSTYF